MAEDVPMPEFYEINADDSATHWVVAADFKQLWSILADHEVGCEMEPGDRITVKRLDPADAAKVLISDEEASGKLPLTTFGAGSFFSTEW